MENIIDEKYLEETRITNLKHTLGINISNENLKEILIKTLFTN